MCVEVRDGAAVVSLTPRLVVTGKVCQVCVCVRERERERDGAAVVSLTPRLVVTGKVCQVCVCVRERETGLL